MIYIYIYIYASVQIIGNKYSKNRILILSKNIYFWVGGVLALIILIGIYVVYYVYGMLMSVIRKHALSQQLLSTSVIAKRVSLV